MLRVNQDIVDFVPNRMPILELYQNEHKISNLLYYKIIHDKAPLVQGSKLLWEQYFDIHIDDTVWERICKRTNQLTISTKLRLFRYKIVQRSLVTNIQLRYYGILENNNCTFCKQHRETIAHLFWDCTKVKALWNRFFHIVKNVFMDNRLKQLPFEIICDLTIAKPSDYLNTLTL